MAIPQRSPVPSDWESRFPPVNDRFRGARGRPYAHKSQNSRKEEDAAQAAAAGEVDTFDLLPPSKEKDMLREIQTYLDQGDAVYAANLLQQVLAEDSGYDFSGELEDQLQRVMERVSSALATPTNTTNDAGADGTAERRLREWLEEEERRRRAAEAAKSVPKFENAEQDILGNGLALAGGGLAIGIAFGLF